MENNLVGPTLQKDNFNNKPLIKRSRREAEICSYTMSLAWIMYQTVSKIIHYNKQSAISFVISDAFRWCLSIVPAH